MAVIYSIPQLETLIFVFVTPVRNRDIERQLTNTSMMTAVTLLNLGRFTFQGVGTWNLGAILFIGSPPLAPRSFNSTSSINPHFLFHNSCGL